MTENLIVEILEGRDVRKTRELYSEVFSEDSTEFVDYYFKYKADDNICFVIRNQNRIVSMLYLTPYELEINQNIRSVYKTFYIVAVATAAEYRHRGLMRKILNSAEEYAEKKGIEFLFLMPANPEIYRPFGFDYFYEREIYQLKEEALKKDFQLKKAEKIESEEIALFAQKILQENYQYYIRRTKKYYETMYEELESQNGGIFKIFYKDRCVGCCLIAKEKEVYVQEVLCLKEWRPVIFEKNTGLFEITGTKPMIMGKGIKKQLSAPIKDLLAGKIKNGIINETV